MGRILLAAAAGFCVLIIFYLIGKLLGSTDTVIRRRLKKLENMGYSSDRREEKEIKKKKKSGLGLFKVSDKLKQELKKAGLTIRAEEFILLWILAVGGPAFIVYMFKKELIAAVFVGIVGFIIPIILVSILKKRRLETFGKQLGDALGSIAGCIRSGLSFRQSMERVTKDMPNPINEEFQITIKEIEYGASLNVALTEMAKRMENEDLALINSALKVQQKVGGNMAEIIDNVAATIKERIILKQVIKTLTSQGKASGAVVGILPVFLFFVLTLINPEYIGDFVGSFLGKALILFGVIWEGIGLLVIRKMINIHI